jgi:hypothetical protein
MAIIKNYEEFSAYKKQKEELKIANKAGFSSYVDLEYAAAKELSRDPRFSLNKNYYGLCQSYLKDVANSCLNFLRTGSLYSKKENGKTFKLTKFGINELVEAVKKNNEDIINHINFINLDIDYVIEYFKPIAAKSNEESEEIEDKNQNELLLKAK